MNKSKGRIVLWLCFAAYLLVLLQIVFYRFSMSALTDPSRVPIQETNLIPLLNLLDDFQDVSLTVVLSNILGNLVIFIPMGVFLRALWGAAHPAILLTAILASTVCIETVQYVTGFGIFDLDDILLNFIGGLLGLMAYSSLDTRAKARQASVPVPAALTLAGAGPVLLLTLIALL